jgi:hypothetical protein
MLVLVFVLVLVMASVRLPSYRPKIDQSGVRNSQYLIFPLRRKTC